MRIQRTAIAVLLCWQCGIRPAYCLAPASVQEAIGQDQPAAEGPLSRILPDREHPFLEGPLYDDALLEELRAAARGRQTVVFGFNRTLTRAGEGEGYALREGIMRALYMLRTDDGRFAVIANQENHDMDARSPFPKWQGCPTAAEVVALLDAPDAHNASHSTAPTARPALPATPLSEAYSQ